jgi:hypothetical protein
LVLPVRRATEGRSSSGEVGEETGQGEGVLLCQDLRGRHHDDLLTGRDGRAGRGRSDDRLAAPDVPLEQAVHRDGTGDVGEGLAEGLPLGTGQGERETAHERARGRDAGRQVRRGALDEDPLALEEAELEQEDVVEDQAARGGPRAAAAQAGSGRPRRPRGARSAGGRHGPRAEAGRGACP